MIQRWGWFYRVVAQKSIFHDIGGVTVRGCIKWQAVRMRRVDFKCQVSLAALSVRDRQALFFCPAKTLSGSFSWILIFLTDRFLCLSFSDISVLFLFSRKKLFVSFISIP